MQYLKGICLDYQYWYPFETKPSLFELLRYGDKIDFKAQAPFIENSKPLNPIEFCLSLMPPEVIKTFL